jgi:hypothetical protein
LKNCGCEAAILWFVSACFDTSAWLSVTLCSATAARIRQCGSFNEAERKRLQGGQLQRSWMSVETKAPPDSGTLIEKLLL